MTSGLLHEFGECVESCILLGPLMEGGGGHGGVYEVNQVLIVGVEVDTMNDA